MRDTRRPGHPGMTGARRDRIAIAPGSPPRRGWPSSPRRRRGPRCQKTMAAGGLAAPRCPTTPRMRRVEPDGGRRLARRRRMGAEMSTIPDTPASTSRGACWRPTARWLPAMSRPSTSPRCSTPGGRCCTRGSSTSAASRSSGRAASGTFSPVNGEEAAVVGSASALDPARDWVVPQYRELPAMLRQGYPLRARCSTSPGDPAGGHVARGVRVLPFQISLAAQIPHAVGLAWGLRHQGSRRRRLRLLRRRRLLRGRRARGAEPGRRAARAGRLPPQNNGWAISTPRAQADGRLELRARAAGYGIPGALVDGNDLLRCTTSPRRRRARGRGRAKAPT